MPCIVCVLWAGLSPCLELPICADVRRNSTNIITRTNVKQPRRITPPLGSDIIDPRDDLRVDYLVIVDIMSLALDDHTLTDRIERRAVFHELGCYGHWVPDHSHTMRLHAPSEMFHSWVLVRSPRDVCRTYQSPRLWSPCIRRVILPFLSSNHLYL